MSGTRFGISHAGLCIMTSPSEQGIANSTAVGNVIESSLETHPAWPMICRLPVWMTVQIPVTGFTVRNLLELHAGHTVFSSWASADDVPLKAGALQIASGEFEVVQHRMAVRLTTLS
jgi:flagellar motor switch/type III secretory pathway protein FliN